jgi:hypothetical protein
MKGSCEASVIVPGAGRVPPTNVRNLVSPLNETQFVPFVELKRFPPAYRLSVTAMGKGEPLWLVLKTTTENTSPAFRKTLRERTSKVVNSAATGAIDEFANVFDPKIVEFGAPEVTPLICRVMSPNVTPSNFLIAKSTEARIPDLPAVITCAAKSEPIAVPAVSVPRLDWSKSGATQRFLGGNTVGSKMIVCAPAFAVAVVIASLRLPGPESLMLVTVISWAQDDLAPKSRKLKASARWKRYCDECDRVSSFFIARFSCVVLMHVSPHTVIGEIEVVSDQSYGPGCYGPRIDRWFG